MRFSQQPQTVVYFAKIAKRGNMTSEPYQETEAFFSDLFDRLFPLLRSITGPGLRGSYELLRQYMPLGIEQIPTGTQVFDWTVPKEWQCDEAYVLDPDGDVIIDMKDCNLHVVNYSAPVDATVTLQELLTHVYSIPDKPTAIPYVCSYYKERWGFCMSDAQKQTLKDGNYRAVIKSRFIDGGVDIAQAKLEGRIDKEILVASYLCHPSMANNELSGPLVLLGLYHRIAKWPRRNHTFRFSMQPETIGTLCMLHRHFDELSAKAVAGVVLNMMGGNQERLTVKHSLFKDGLIDKAARHLTANGQPFELMDFTPNSGADERHYATPGIRIPVCNVTRDFYPAAYEGYHNSLDTKDYMRVSQLMKAIDEVEKLLLAADSCVCFENLAPYGEPHLGPRGLYPTLNFVGGTKEEAERRAFEELCQIKWLTTLSDGDHDLIDIAERNNANVLNMLDVVAKLEDLELLKLVPPKSLTEQ